MSGRERIILIWLLSIQAVQKFVVQDSGAAHAGKNLPRKLYPKGSKDMAIKAYVILDDQSNRSLARPELFELFDVDSEQFSYHLRTCSGIIETSGKKAEGFQIESLDGKVFISLPPLIECHEIMNNRSEIPTPSAVLYQPHLRHIAKLQN